MKKARNIILVFCCLTLAGYVLVAYYPYIFSRKVVGTVTAVERINAPNTVVTVGGRDNSNQIYSFGVGVKDDRTGEIVTASSEDHQWAVAKPGECVEAQFLPYPPWNIERMGTYMDVRLLKLRECPFGH